MKILMSPAKTLNFTRSLPIKHFTQPIFLEEAEKINGILRDMSPSELSELLGISRKLAELNWERNQKWHLPFTTDNSYPAIFAFDGPAYHGLNPFEIAADKLDKLQGSLRIISGLHGLLKPFDIVQPYRMEMGIRLKVDDKTYLKDFWKDKVTQALNEELTEEPFVINLASKEYFSAIDTKKLKTVVYSIEFKEFIMGRLKTIVIYTKRARGLMTRFLVINNAQTLEDVKNFDSEGYYFDEKLSTNSVLTFVR